MSSTDDAAFSAGREQLISTRAETAGRLSNAALLPGGGAMGSLMRAHDWSRSSLGPPSTWSRSLLAVTRLLLNSKFPMFVAWGDELGFLYNDAYAEILGAKHPKALGRPFREIWAEIWPDISPLIDSALRGEATFSENLPLVMNRKGYDEQTWFTFSYSPVQDDDGHVAGMFCAVAETTGQILAETQLRESEARYRALFEAVDAGFCVMEMKYDETLKAVDYRYVEVNPAFETQTGVAGAKGRWIRELLPDLEQHWFDIYGRVGLTGESVRFENRAEPVGRWYDVHAFRIDAPELHRVAILFNDITERRAAEQDLRDLNETLEQQVADRSAERDRLWHLSQDLLARADYSGMMSAVSPAWTQVLGWSETELLSRGYATFMHPEDMPPTLAAIQRMGESHEPARFENRIATRDGGWKNIEWTVSPEPDGLNFIAVGRDVSTTRAHEAELALAQDALRQSQKMEAMGQLTGGVAHDFNNLLTPIIGALDMLERGPADGDRQRRLIAGAMQSADRAKVLVQRLLAFARRQPLRPAPVNLADLASGIADLVSSTIGPQIKVVVDAPPPAAWAMADSNQLEMAILNLSVNARDAMPAGGVLKLIVSEPTSAEAILEGLRPGSHVRLSVTDTGVGMDKATIARAVEPFFSTKGVGKGTGLGLSMVHGLVTQLEGILTIDSKPGSGTTVSLWLPKTGPAPAVGKLVPQPTAVVTHKHERGTALLVDDEDVVRSSTADMLSDLGYRVLEAASGEEALWIVGRGEPLDLVVTDHLMPGMTGVELAQAVRRCSPGLPVLIVSGYAEAEGIASDMPLLAKPFRRDELADSIARL